MNNPTAKTSKKTRLLEILQDALNRGVNLGTQPNDAPEGKERGWVTGWYLAMNGCGLRYGANIHELRHISGIAIQTHIEWHDGNNVSFYRLDEPKAKVEAAPVTVTLKTSRLFDFENSTYGRD